MSFESTTYYSRVTEEGLRAELTRHDLHTHKGRVMSDTGTKLRSAQLYFSLTHGIAGAAGVRNDDCGSSLPFRFLLLALMRGWQWKGFTEESWFVGHEYSRGDQQGDGDWPRTRSEVAQRAAMSDKMASKSGL